MISEEQKKIYRMVTEGLTERDIFILEYRILGFMALDEIGERYGISRERARQLEKKIKTRLRRRLVRSRNGVSAI